MTLEAIKYQRGDLQILNQLLIPQQTLYEKVTTVRDGWSVIKLMKVRGAPAIAIVGCLSLAVEMHNSTFSSVNELSLFVQNSLNHLITARPTAVNLSKASTKLINLSIKLERDASSVDSMKTNLIEEIEKMLSKDIDDNKRLSEYGANHILQNSTEKSVCNILTHCNTGSLATAGYGTALGIIRSLHKRGALKNVYFTETRPYNQGARLTAYELAHDQIPSILVADSMVALLMKTQSISAVIVGADRVARNGDTANKIGTYQIAVLAKHHNVPFYVAAPQSCHCDDTESGNDIIIEERNPDELTCINGIRIAAEGVSCWNPAFDVTPHCFITGIVTEFGIYTPDEFHKLNPLKDTGSYVTHKLFS